MVVSGGGETARAEDDPSDAATGKGEGGGGGGGGGGKRGREGGGGGKGSVRCPDDGKGARGGGRDPANILELCASITDQNAMGIQIRLNQYLSRWCGAELSFLILVSDDEEELTVHVLGDQLLPSTIKIPVNNNSFSTALSSRRPMTLEDIEPAHREDVWKLLGLIPETKGVVSGVRRVSVDPAIYSKLKFCANAHNGSAKAVEESGSVRTRGLTRDVSIDYSKDPKNAIMLPRGVPTSPSASVTSMPNFSKPKDNAAAAKDRIFGAGGDGDGSGGVSSSRSSSASSRPQRNSACRVGLTPLEADEDVLSMSPNATEETLPSFPKSPQGSSSVTTDTTPNGTTSTITFDFTPPKSLLCVPISAPGKETSAVLVCLVNKKSGQFGKEDIETVKECFKYTVGMLVNTVGVERERRLRTQCQALLSVAQNLFTHLDDVTVLLREIMAEARQLTDAERCSLFLLDRDQQQLVAKVFDGERKEESNGEVRLPANQGIAGHVATTGQLLNIRDAYAHPLFYRGFDECTGFKTRNILCFPIKEDGQVIGVAELCNKTTGLHFTRFDEEIATAFSIYCGISINNSLLYKKVFDTQVRSKLSNELMMFHMKVTKEEVDRLVQAEVLEPSDFNKDFCSFRYFPRQLPESRTPSAVISMMENLGMIQKFRISRDCLARFILMVRKGYRDPPYHNWMHAFSVTHFAFLLLHNLRLTETGALTHLEALSLIVSSMCHDLDHRGTTNSFQVASNSVLASLYSSEGSVMERHHLAQAMCILNTDDCNFLENLSREEYTQFLDLMRDIILATDLAHHLRLVSELREVAESGYDPSNPRHHELLICLLMTAADLSDQTKDWHSSKHVAELIYKEFFTQGDLEKAMGNMPMEMMDREKAFIPELQLQFLDDVAIPVYEIVAKMFPGAQDPYNNIKARRRNWARLRDVYKKRKPESTSSLEVFEDDSLEDELIKDES
ncbi:cGMP-dependent 3',5'-cyclic phosphodiesterase-like isoform X2 [Macrobrachium rosenbergii]